MRNFIFFAILLFFTACSSVSYRVNSNPPEAEVFGIARGSERKLIGKTPLVVDAETVNPTRDSFIIEVKKDGFESQNILIPDSFFKKSVVVDMSLIPLGNLSDSKKSEAALAEVASAVADIQKDIQTKNYEIAATKLNRMIAAYPTIATFYSLSGNVHYLEKRLDKALSFYKKALQLNPNLFEVQKIVEKIEGLDGGVR